MKVVALRVVRRRTCWQARPDSPDRQAASIARLLGIHGFAGISVENLAQHGGDRRRIEPAASQCSGHPTSASRPIDAPKARRSTSRHLPCRVQFPLAGDLGQRRLDRVLGDALVAQLGRQDSATLQATGRRRHPVAGESGVVDQPDLLEAVDHGLSRLVGHAATTQATTQFLARPRPNSELSERDLTSDRNRVSIGWFARVVGPAGSGFGGSQNSTSPVIGSIPSGTASAGPIPSCARMRRSISSAMLGLRLRKLRAFSLP